MPLKKDENPFDNPLIKAIKSNDVEKLRNLLKQGKKPDLRYAFTDLCENNTSPEVLDLFVEYDALPHGVTLSTLKLVLFSMGNRRISQSDFWDKSDLNLNGCPQLQTPIKLFSKFGNIQGVLSLIQRGVTERPINYLFGSIHSSHFMGCDLLHVDQFKNQISSIFEGPKFHALEDTCQVAELLLRNPTPELEAVFKTGKDTLYYDMRFLPFFAWAAKNNKAELFKLPHFKRLFQEDKKSAKEAVVIAAAFGSISFLTKAIQEGLVSSTNITSACCVAAAHNNNALLNALISISRNECIYSMPGKGIRVRKVSGIYHLESTESALFWAIRNGHDDTAEILLQAEACPNALIDKSSKNSYLQLATRLGYTELMKLLIAYKADINHQDVSGKTALHEAAKQNNLEALAILITAGADINLPDENGTKALDGLRNDVRNELQELLNTIRSKKTIEERNKADRVDQGKLAPVFIKIDKAINSLNEKICKIENHYSSVAHLEAISLLKKLNSARKEYYEALQSPNADKKGAALRFRGDCVSAIRMARTTLEQDLAWGDYLSNLLKDLVNGVIWIFSLGLPNNFFSYRKSNSILIVEQAVTDLIAESRLEF